MKTITVAGKSETIFDISDFSFLVEKYMGHDAADYIREYLEEAAEEVRSAQAGENTDLQSYEASYEADSSAFEEILDVCGQMEEEYRKETGRNKLVALRPWMAYVGKIKKLINTRR